MFEDEDLACVSTRRYRRASVCQLRVAMCVGYVCVCARTWGDRPRDVNQNQHSRVPAGTHPLQLRGSPGVGKQHFSEIQVERNQP